MKVERSCMQFGDMECATLQWEERDHGNIILMTLGCKPYGTTRHRMPSDALDAVATLRERFAGRVYVTGRERHPDLQMEGTLLMPMRSADFIAEVVEELYESFRIPEIAYTTGHEVIRPAC